MKTPEQFVSDPFRIGKLMQLRNIIREHTSPRLTIGNGVVAYHFTSPEGAELYMETQADLMDYELENYSEIIK